MFFSQGHIFTLIPRRCLKFATHDFTAAKGFSILFHRHHKHGYYCRERWSSWKSMAALPVKLFLHPITDGERDTGRDATTVLMSTLTRNRVQLFRYTGASFAQHNIGCLMFKKLYKT